MPKFLEAAIRHHGATVHGFTGRRLDEYTFGAMNNLGAMKGNKITAKGRRMEKKHVADMRRGKSSY